jgi:hypothetical protein
MLAAVTLSLYFTLRCLATGNTPEDLKTSLCICLQLGRQMLTEWILLSSVHRLLNIFKTAQENQT